MADGQAPSGNGQTASPSAAGQDASAVPAAVVPSGGPPTEASSSVQLPTPPALPGVWDAGHDQNADEDKAQAQKVRGPDGRFVSTSETQDGEAQPEAKPEPEKPTAKFKFGGIEWESSEKAEQNFKTLRGQYRSMQNQRDVAAASANEQAAGLLAWKAEAERLQQELNQYSQGNTSGQQPAADEGADASNPLSAIDWSLYQTLHDEQGPKVAAAWLYEQTLNTLKGQVLGEVKETYDPKFQPIEEREQHTRMINQLVEVFQEAGALKFEDGQMAYPELSDAKATSEIGYILKQLGLPDEMERSVRGVHLAVVAYRDRQARLGRAGQSNQPTAQPGAGSQTAGQVAAAAAAANAAASGVIAGASPPAIPRPAANAAEGSEMAMRASIKNAGNIRPDLGFGD